jgi:hypothetical protein
MSESSPTIGAIQLSKDRRLVRDILRGDERALRSFYDEHFPRLYRPSGHWIDRIPDWNEWPKPAAFHCMRE